MAPVVSSRSSFGDLARKTMQKHRSAERSGSARSGEPRRVSHGRAMSLEAFLRLEAPTGIKYEWNNGAIEHRPTMKPKERIIADNIVRAFIRTELFQHGYTILQESDVPLSSVDTYRRPDMCLLSREQIRNADTDTTAPLLVIELISHSNTDIAMLNKLQEYFAGGVHKVWYIYPDNGQVWVFDSPKSVVICSDADQCLSGMAEFSMSAQDMLADYIPDVPQATRRKKQSS
jgi:Uma2 family endonuclease